jgi:DNA-directed RNA polymerase specialized sigma24 family protein
MRTRPIQQLTPTQQQLLLDNLPFARWYARMFSTRAEREEARAICILAMAEAATLWEEGREAKFHSYASVFMRRRLIDEYRNKRRVAKQLLDKPEQIVDRRNVERQERLIRWLETAGYSEASISDLDTDILRAYLERHSIQYVARKHGYSGTPGISRPRAKLFMRLRLRAIADGLL